MAIKAHFVCLKWRLVCLKRRVSEMIFTDDADWSNFAYVALSLSKLHQLG